MKRTIRLTESDLHRIVRESVKRVLNENDNDDNILYRIYSISSDAINGNGDQRSALSEICDLYAQITTPLPPEIDGLLQKVVNHVNHDVESGTTFREYIADGYSILEDLSGFLGEYFE